MFLSRQGVFALSSNAVTSERYINNTGRIYEQELAVVKIEAGNVTSVTRQMGSARMVDADKLGGNLPGYYGTAAAVTAAQTTANSGVSQANAAQATANAAMPKAGGVFTGGINTRDIAPVANGSYYLGSSAAKWAALFCNTVDVFNRMQTVQGYFMQNGPGIQAVLQNTRFEVLNLAGTAYAPCMASAFPIGSSVRYKDIIGAMASSKARALYDIDLIEYKYKKEYSDDGKKVHFGVKAEQAHELGFTDVVSYDAEGNPEGVDYSKFTPYLIKLCQMQQKQIDRLTELLVQKKVMTRKEAESE